jgi:sulfur transfer protein SufE
MCIDELQDEVIEEFSDFTDWMDKYQLLIDLGNDMEPLEEKYKTRLSRSSPVSTTGWTSINCS